MSLTPAQRAAAWSRAFARQAESDFAVYDLLCRHPEIAECQRLHALQMAMEKAVKAGVALQQPPRLDIHRHDVVEKSLGFIVLDMQTRDRRAVKRRPGLARAVRRLAREVDRLAPAVRDGGARPDNVEVPWEVKRPDGAVEAIHSPLDHVFAVSRLVRDPAVVGVLKMVRAFVASAT